MSTKTILRKFNTRYDHARPPGLRTPEQTRTKQAFKDECDINNILKKYRTTGVLPEMINRNPVYGDFSEAYDYQEAMNIVMHAQEQFAALPADVRERFGNDPVNFLSFATDEKNLPEMRKMGLAQALPDIPEEQPAPQGDDKT